MERTSSRRRLRQSHNNSSDNSQETSRAPAYPTAADTSSQGTAHSFKSIRSWSKSQLVTFVTVLSWLAFLATSLRVLGIPGFAGYLPVVFSSSDERVLDSFLLSATDELQPEAHIYRAETTIRLNWTVTAGYLRPDGVRKRVYLINGAFPAPIIEARSGDRLIINVTNDLKDQGVTLHWHGLHMRDANRMDGTTGVTQCAVTPGDSFLYDFTISESQSGTYWYHAHSGLQRADGLYGGLVIHRPALRPVRGIRYRHAESDILKYNYQKEILLLVGDWYHRPADEVLKWYMRAGSYGNEPVPDSLLINGVGRFDCAMAVPARPVDCSEDEHLIPQLTIDPSYSYRVRVVNTGSLSGVSLGFSQGHLDLIQIDGGLDARQGEGSGAFKSRSIGVLYPGQRVDFILRHSRNAQATSSLMVELDPECFKYPNPALSSLQAFPILADISDSTRKIHMPKPRPLPIKNHIDLAQISSTPALLSALPPEANQTYVVYTKISQMSKNQNMPMGYFNQTSWRPQSDPPYPLIALSPRKWDKNQFAITTGSEPVWVDLVVNNLDEGPHPFHLHGHSFFVLTVHSSSLGWGSYNPFNPHQRHQQFRPSSNDLAKAVLRDTVQIPRRGHAVLRFRADNPGIWLFHCHILWHLASGMAMVVDVMNGFESGEAVVTSRGDLEMTKKCRYS
ncbi:hypothetical protein AJ79_08056 [Helicocarpus griseus UAMH5409]|uniref:L-ascorbate oxidase n=1 Tax=Helicocarpus griseus UAMH5409 TaxID=1447875 RepID=A0A2B7WWX1_9EURO|nr:hypothetical protein AJ79_08056 [Helicocarpus griseus UAMH5409]